jgi:glycine cleavage system H protein
MATISGCDLPENLYYLTDKHVWVRWESAERVTIGMDDVAQHLAGTVVAFTPKKVGRSVAKGQSVATLESSKWVGPVPAPVSGEILEVNEAVRTDPKVLNADPYGAGWLVRLKPAAWDADKGGLVTGAEGIEAYRAVLARDGIRCDAAGA